MSAEAEPTPERRDPFQPSAPVPDLDALAAQAAEQERESTAADNGTAPPAAETPPRPPRTRDIDQRMVMAHDARIDQLEAEVVGLRRAELCLLIAVAAMALLNVVDVWQRRRADAG